MGREALPVELAEPGIWVPAGRGQLRVLLPWAGTASANAVWLREALEGRLVLARGEGSSWLVGRDRVDELAAAMVERFGPGTVTVVRDVSMQRRCGPLCQNGKPERALYCECQCGGENHGGAAAGWMHRGDFLIDTEHRRRVWLL